MEGLVGKTRKPVTVAIIDSGIDTSVFGLDDFVKKSTGFCVNKEGFIVEDENRGVTHQHGTIIAAIMTSLCRNIEITSMNIFNERLATDGRVLIYALKHAISYRPDIIHLSLGTTRWRYKHALKKLVNQAVKNNILIVSAANNEGHTSYPASLRGVVGVRAGRFHSYDSYFFKDGYFHAPLDAGIVQGLSDFINEPVFGTSMSAAYMTGHSAQVLTDTRPSDPWELVNILKNKFNKQNEEGLKNA